VIDATRRPSATGDWGAKDKAELLMTETSIKDFEAAIAELESVVKKLEAGDLSLEQSLASYERGVQLSRFCHARLEEAERRIEILNERGEVKPAPASLTAGDERSLADPPKR
jgi:exodeoxyribonuclease VII small subunit